MEQTAAQNVVDGWALARDFLLPSLAILIPTLIAIYLARRERISAETARREEAAARALEEREREERRAVRRAEKDRRREESRRLRAGADVITALAHMVTFSGVSEDLSSSLRALRASIAVYGSAAGVAGAISADWLRLKHMEGVRLWATAMETMDAEGGPSKILEARLDELMDPPRSWANDTLQTLSAWLSGDLDDEVLRRQGAAVMSQLGGDVRGMDHLR